MGPNLGETGQLGRGIDEGIPDDASKEEGEDLGEAGARADAVAVQCLHDLQWLHQREGEHALPSVAGTTGKLL